MASVAQFAPITVSHSPSHTFNNLSCNGNLVAYVHRNEVHIFNESSVVTKKAPTLRKATLKEDVPISQVKWVKAGERQFLVISTHTTIEILESEAVKSLFTFPLPTDKGAKSFGSGITTMFNGKENHILCGNSVGEIYAFEVKKEIKLVQQLKHHKVGIIDLNSDDSNTNIWASSDISGKIIVWKSFEVLSTIESPDQHPCNSIAIRGDRLFSVYGTGHIRIWSISKKQKSVEICAHSQAINALHLHPTKELFATASDDSLISIWRFKGDSNETTFVSSFSITNFLIVGVQFCGENQTTILAAPFDSNSLPVWELKFE